jgi:hypothetical protein
MNIIDHPNGEGTGDLGSRHNINATALSRDAALPRA